MPPPTYKLTLVCEPTQRGSGNHAVVGPFLSEAWFKVLEYWLSNKLSAEGLQVTSFTVEEQED